jgi:hypothetical protein
MIQKMLLLVEDPSQTNDSLFFVSRKLARANHDLHNLNKPGRPAAVSGLCIAHCGRPRW